MEPGELVIFQPVLQTYPTRHSWIITVHVSLWNLECHWKLFKRQVTRTQQFLRSLDQHPSAPTQLLTTLQLELSNIQDIYTSSKTTITSAINLLNSNQLQTGTWHKRSLLPFLGTTLSWLTGTATTKDIRSIKSRINQLIETQTSQHNTLVHIVSILNVTRYATQVNRHSINNLIDAIHTMTQDINNLYNLTMSLAANINFNQMILHIRSVFANLQDSLHYLYTVSTHTMDYIDAATSGILSPHVLPVVDLQKMLWHIADTLPPTLHLPISPEDTLHSYRYLRTHVLIENNSSYFWSTFLYKIELTWSPYTKFLLWIFPMETTQLTMMSTLDTLESPRMPQWDWNYLAHNFRHVNRLMDNSATSLHLSNLWLIHQHALLPYMPRVKPA